MPRIRTIKPEFPQSESMGNITRDARLLFIQLWTLADDSGRLRGASRMLASLLYPYDDDAPRLIDSWLGELSEEGCIVIYKHGTQTYIEICNWLSHQKIDKPSQSKYPAFDEASRILAKPRECSSEDQGPKDQGPKDQGHAPKRDENEESFKTFYDAYPRKEARGQALKAYKATIRKGISAEAILDRLLVYKSRLEKAGTERQFMRLPATFLHNLDDYEAAPEAPEPEYKPSLPERIATPEERAMLDRMYGRTRDAQ